MKQTSMVIEQEIRAQRTLAQITTSATVTLVCLTAQFKPQAIPAALLQALKGVESARPV
jgi:acyl-CoA thioesterase FadM